MEIKRKDKLIYFTTFLILLGIVVLRFVGVENYSLWQDELTLHLHSQRTFESVMSYSLNHAMHPPLFFMFYKPWISIIDFSEFSLRSFHIIVGIVTSFLPLLFRRTLGVNKAVVFSLLMLTNLNLMKWSQEALVYSLVIFFLVLFILFFENALKKTSWRDYLAPVVLLIIINYLNYFALAIVNLYVLLSLISLSKNNNLLQKNITLLVISVVTYIPWILSNHLIRSFIGLSSNTGSIRFWNHSSNLWTDILDSLFFFFNYDYFILIVFIITLSLSFRKESNPDMTRQLFVFTRVIFGFICFLAYNSMGSYSLFVSKYFLLLIPFFLIIYTNVIIKFQKEAQLFFIILWGIMNIIPFNSYTTLMGHHDYRAAISDIGKIPLAERDKLVIFAYNPNWFNAYFKSLGAFNDFKILGARGDCQKEDRIKHHVHSLKAGDVIFFPDTVCSNKFLLTQLKEKKLKYLANEFKNVQVLRLVNQSQ